MEGSSSGKLFGNFREMIRYKEKVLYKLGWIFVVQRKVYIVLLSKFAVMLQGCQYGEGYLYGTFRYKIYSLVEWYMYLCCG